MGRALAINDLAAVEIDAKKLFLVCLGERFKSLFGFAALLGASNPDGLMFTELLENTVCHGSPVVAKNSLRHVQLTASPMRCRLLCAMPGTHIMIGTEKGGRSECRTGFASTHISDAGAECVEGRWERAFSPATGKVLLRALQVHRK